MSDGTGMGVGGDDGGAVARTSGRTRGSGGRPGGGPATWLVALVAALVVAGVAFGGVAIGRSSAPSASSTSGAVKHPVALTASHSVVAANSQITVTGSGTVQGTPNTVSFQIGIQTVEDTAIQALSVNNGQIASLEATLLRHGVTKKEMQTSGLNIYENTYKGVLTGFTVDNDLDVTMNGVADAGSAIDAAAQAAGNGIQLYGISFSISNESRLLAAARSRAMHNARVEASQVAAGANATVGGIVRVTDQENSNTGVFYGYGAANALSASAARVPLEAGSEPLSVKVTVVYALVS